MTSLAAQLTLIARRRRVDCLVRVGACLGLLVTLAGAARADTLFIENATVLVGDGTRLEKVSIKIENGKITGIGTLVPPSEGDLIDAEGKVVTPGLIDVWSTLGARLGASGGVAAQARAADAFDAHAEQELLDALRQGVTAVYIPGRNPDGLGGRGAVVRLMPGARAEQWLLRGEASLCASIGVAGRINALGRLRALREFQAVWQQARDYRKTHEDYAVDLKEYEEKVRKRGPDVPRAAGDEKRETTSPASEPAPRREGPPDRPRRRPRPQPQDESAAADESYFEDPPKPEDAKGEKKDEKKDEIKKPEEPKKDRNLELALDVIDGKLLLRVEVERPQDILNVLATANRHNLAVVLEGGSGAPAVADVLAEYDVPVVLGASEPTLQFDAGPRRDRQADAARMLAQAGVRVFLGSGPQSGGATANLALRAAATVGPGFDSDRAFRTITADAAELLGVEDEIGRVRDGLAGDLVIWSEHPFAPGAKVEHVIVGGRMLFDRKQAAKSEPPRGGE